MTLIPSKHLGIITKELTDDLISKFDYFVDSGNVNSYSGSGSNMVDLTGNYGLTSLINGITFNPTTKGLILNGTNQYIQTPVNHVVQPLEDFTYFCTFKTAQTNGALLICNYGNSGGGTHPATYMNILASSGYYTVYLRNYGGSKTASINTTTPVNNNIRNVVALRKFGNVYAIFLNGVFLATVTSTVAPINSNLNIVFGVLNLFFNGSWFNGEFYNMGINKTIGYTDTEINDISQILLTL